MSTMASNSKDPLCGGYPCQFVGSLPKNLQAKCSICLLILREPYQVDCCGYRFCRNCLDPLLVSKQCPSCNDQFSKATYDTSLEKKLNKCIVYCTSKSEGCLWTGELQSLATHKLSCLSKHVTVMCTPVRKFQGTNTEMEKHVKSCPDRLIPCPNKCGSNISSKNVNRHVRKKCPLSIHNRHPLSTASCDHYKSLRVSLNDRKKAPCLQTKGSSSNTIRRLPLDKPKKGPSSCAAKIQQKGSKTPIKYDSPLPFFSECKHCKDFRAPSKKLKGHEKFCHSKFVSTSVPKRLDQVKFERCPNGCSARMRPNEIEIHIRDHCPHTIFHCPYCNEFLAPKRKLKKHIANCQSRISSYKLEKRPICSRPIYRRDFAYTGRMPDMTRSTPNFILTLILEAKKEQQDLALMRSNIQRLERENSTLRTDKVALQKDNKKLRQKVKQLTSANAAKDQVMANQQTAAELKEVDVSSLTTNIQP